jgi:hypothetical protein
MYNSSNSTRVGMRYRVGDTCQQKMPKEKAKNDKQRSGKHTYQTKDRVTRTLFKTVGELR